MALSSTLLTPFALLLIQICQFDNHQWHNTFTNFLPRGLLSTRTRAYCHPFPWHCFPPSPRFPLLHILGVLLLSLTPLLSVASFFLVNSGFLTSWTYLRFYKPAFPDLETSQPTSLRGDASETFAFAEFFPDPAKQFVAAFSNQIYNILVSLRICTPFSAADVSASRGETFMQRGTPGSARAEAERRRALALKALDQRLHAATAGSKAQPPPPPVAGPSVQIQPQPNVQTPSTMLGETSYVPERDDEKGAH